MAKAKPKIKIENVKALVELERAGYEYESAGADEVKLRCPVHKEGKEATPSATLNIRKNLWICHSAECNAKGDIVSLLAYHTGANRQLVLLDLSKRYDLEVKRTLSPDTVEKFHKQIWDSPFMKELYDRGLDDALIRKLRLGFHNGRITIPVYDESRRIVNVRRYLPGAPGPEKMKNTPGYGGNNIFQRDQLKYPVVWVCGGELKAAVAGNLLTKHNVGAISPTAGEGNWEDEWCELFRDKTVFICLDIDQGGLTGAKILAGYLFNYVKSVSILQLPLDKEKYPKGDINDYVGQEGATDADLIKMMKNSEPWHPPEIQEKDDGTITDVPLSSATHSDLVGKRIRIHGQISSMDTTPYIIPEKVGVSCDKSQPNCSWCPIRPREPDEDSGHVEVSISRSSEGILSLINTSKKHEREAIREALHIPTCKVVEFHVRSHFNVLDTRVSPEMSIGEETSKNIVQPVFIVGQSVEMNTPYVLTGKLYPKPSNKQAILLMDESRLGEDSLSSFNPTEKQLKALRKFQPEAWTADSLDAKLKILYEDLSTNVTRIFHRQDMHLAMDLAYHSPLVFEFDGRETNGWLNLLIIGDSSQGKSETAIRLREHYGAGHRTDCKNATRAGLLGGLHQVGNKWFVSWGDIPTNDRGLCILEEVKGADEDVLSSLTDMRSSGIAQLSKIEKRSAFARTRLIFISNPRSGREVAQYNFGCEVIRELWRGLEDIRRFDLALVISSSQVDANIINKLSTSRPKIKHQFTSALCQRLVLWAWTRTAGQIKFTPEATDAILEAATTMSKKYTEALPLVDRGTIRYKIARLAAALAARTFSTSDFSTLTVRDCHIEAVVRYMNRLYDDPVLGYGTFSKAQIYAHKVKDPKQIKKNIEATKYPRDLVDSLLYSDRITINDLNDWCEVDNDTSKKLLSFFVRKHAMYRVRRDYVKTSEFISLLKDLQSNGLAQSAQPMEGEEF